MAIWVGAELSSETANVHGAKIHYVRGGKGPCLVLIHGFPQDWFEYNTIMPRLMKAFTVIAVDLRGLGDSRASDGFDAMNMAEDIHQLVSALKFESVYLVGHDIGGMVAYAFVRCYPRVTRGAMILDVLLPGIAGWDEIQGHPAMWHVRFMQVPCLPEKLIAGRQADYLGYFFSFGKFTATEVAHYVKAYADEAKLRAVLEMYRAFPANAKFNAEQRERNDVPIFLAAGADGSPFASLIPTMADGLRAQGCTHVRSELIPRSGHYVVDDQPDRVAELIESYGLV